MLLALIDAFDNVNVQFTALFITPLKGYFYYILENPLLLVIAIRIKIQIFHFINRTHHQGFPKLKKQKQKMAYNTSGLKWQMLKEPPLISRTYIFSVL